MAARSSAGIQNDGMCPLPSPPPPLPIHSILHFVEDSVITGMFRDHLNSDT